MTTLLLRLSGPMQSWGTQSRFTVRDTGLEPSKSGVIGLLCAALGRPRSAPLENLAALRMGVRVDREGRVERDYHTAGGGSEPGGGYQGVMTAEGKLRREAVTSNRYYLAGASFLVGLESAERPLLDRLAEAVQRPRWPLYLGRRAFVPASPILVGVVTQPVEDALKTAPWECLVPRERQEALADARKGSPRSLRLVLETDEVTPDVRRDQPVSFAEGRREHGLRYVRMGTVPLIVALIGEED